MSPRRSAVATIQPLDADGLLPPGDYELTLEELRATTLVEGAGTSEHWDLIGAGNWSTTSP